MDGVIKVSAGLFGSTVQIDVEDQGPGIAKADHHRVFARFGKGASSTSTGQSGSGGTGLGLSIAKWAVELHSGQLSIAPSTSGAKLRISLPQFQLKEEINS